MEKERLIESYKKGYEAIKDLPNVILDHDMIVKCGNQKWELKKGDSVIAATPDILGRYMYLMDMIDKAIKMQIITIDELIKITEELI